MNKVIVSCAVTGAIHVPSQSDALPVTPEQIADQAVGAAQAGAAILHLHARNPQTGAPTHDPDVFAEFLPEIRSRCDAVINITTGGGHGMSLEERTAAAARFAPELCSMNMGSMNFGIFPMAQGISSFKHEWEPRYLEMTRDYIFRNTFGDIESLVGLLGAKGTGSSSSATTSATSTTSRTSCTVGSSSRRCSSSSSSGSSAGSGPTPRT